MWQVGKQNLSSITRDQTQAPAVKVLSPYHWTAREFSIFFFFFFLRCLFNPFAHFKFNILYLLYLEFLLDFCIFSLMKFSTF